MVNYYGNKLRLDYGDEIGSSHPLSLAKRAKSLKMVEDNKEKIASKLKIVHGHFFANKYITVPTELRYATMLRNPVQRVLSNYFYLKRKTNRKNPDALIVHQSGATLEDYIDYPDARNVQAQFLDGKSLRDFDFVGITEHYDHSVRLFNRLFCADLQVGDSENANPRSASEYDVSNDIVQRIVSRNQVDVELYREAMSFFKRDCERYLSGI